MSYFGPTVLVVLDYFIIIYSFIQACVGKFNKKESYNYI